MKLLLALLVGALAADTPADRPTPSEGRAAHAVADYTPFDFPRDHALAGVRIGLDWAGGAAGDDQAAHGMPLIAGYLFHAVHQRGGTLVLSHAPGDTADDGAANRSARLRMLQASRCDFIVALYPAAPDAADRTGNAPDEQLAARLGAQLGEGWRVAALAQHAVERKCPAVVVVPPAGTDGAPDWRFARERVGALVQALAEAANALGLAETDAVDEALPGITRAARAAREVWPDGELPPERAAWFCNLVQRLTTTNPSLIYARITAEAAGDGVVLRGASSAPFVGENLLTAFNAVGISAVTSEIQALPNREKLGEQLYGACRVASALTYTAPRLHAGPQTELLFGEPVYLLDRQDDHVLLLGGDGYWGWVAGDAIAPMDAGAFTAYLQAPEAVTVRDVNTAGVRIPRGARVRLANADGAAAVLVPGAAPVAVARDAFAPVDDAATGQRRVAAALDLLHTPYVFGGRSPAGLDCSGLCTNVAARSGAFAARDANQQALAGRLVATAWFRSGLQAGDQVFFIDQSGKVYHTGIAVDATHIVHSAPPGVQIGTFVRGDRLYDERIDRDFFIAKRP